MNSRIDQLVRTLLQKDSLEQCSLPELQQFAERHPYFGAAQLLLTKKLQTDHPDSYDEQLQKTLLFFHNPIWVEHILNDTGKGEIIKTKKEEVPAENTVAATVTLPEDILPAEQPGTSKAEEHVVSSETTGPVIAEIPEPVAETITIPAADEPVKEEVQQPAAEAFSDFPQPGEDPSPAPNEDTVPLNIPSLKIEPVSNTGNELVFEPYHTVDYFASQGIQFREEAKPADKFGQQLRSFTEWLKTLKKVPVSEIVKTHEPASEKKVEEMAETSIKDREVLTETMAEVWEKQGNMAKAIDIYGKLSLLEPSKSTYFAAKIEDLKKQS